MATVSGLKNSTIFTVTGINFEKIQEVCDLTQSHKVLPMNSGAEAVETAIKSVRKWGYEAKGILENKAQIIVCNNNFHGRTLAIIGFSSDSNARNNFGPFAINFFNFKSIFAINKSGSAMISGAKNQALQVAKDRF